MKKIFLLLSAALLCGCQYVTQAPKVNSKIGQSNRGFLKKNIALLSSLQKEDIKLGYLGEEKTQTGTGSELGKSVSLYEELLSLFNPDNFSCGCNEELREKLKKLKAANKDKLGFIPEDVSKNAYYADNVILLDRAGGSILAHGFQYKAGTVTSKLLFAKNAPTVKNFNESDYIEKNPSTYNSFFYTVDCSGYLSAAISVVAGVGKNALKTSAAAAQLRDKSLLLINGVMYLPLYQAFKGDGAFAKSDKITLTNRLETLRAIVSEIPSAQRIPSVKIILNSNYRVIITSNSGSASFNGEAKMAVAGGFSFVFGAVSGETDGKGTVERKSTFSNFKTYIVEENVGAEPENITYADITALITDLQTKVAIL